MLIVPYICEPLTFVLAYVPMRLTVRALAKVLCVPTALRLPLQYPGIPVVLLGVLFRKPRVLCVAGFERLSIVERQFKDSSNGAFAPSHKVPGTAWYFPLASINNTTVQNLH